MAHPHVLLIWKFPPPPGCLWSKNFELQKCGHTGKSNYGQNLSIILMFLTIYGVEKSQCDRSNYRFQSKQKFRCFYSYRLQCTSLISSMQRKICSLRPFCLSASLIAPMHAKVHSLSAKVVPGTMIAKRFRSLRIHLELHDFMLISNHDFGQLGY